MVVFLVEGLSRFLVLSLSFSLSFVLSLLLLLSFFFVLSVLFMDTNKTKNSRKSASLSVPILEYFLNCSCLSLKRNNLNTLFARWWCCA